MAKVVGVGGVFFKSSDPKGLASWYQEHLGVPIDASFGGAAFMAHGIPKGGYTIWSPFKADTTYFEPSKQPFMINLMVDDLDGALAQVKAAGAELHGEPESSEFGKFGWFSDPDGNKVELWQPPEAPYAG
ncbi:MAG: VOC family protein [Woeseiaceae bacterium]